VIKSKRRMGACLSYVWGEQKFMRGKPPEENRSLEGPRLIWTKIIRTIL